MPRSPRFLALLFALLLAGPLALVFSPLSSARADGEGGEEPPADQPAEPPTEKPAEEARRPTLHKVYVPFRDLSKVFEKEGEGVFLPYDEFLDLWRKANGLAGGGTPEMPVPATVRAAAYEGDARGGLVSLKATLEVEVLAEGWQRIPLDFSGAGIEKATLDDQPALLVPAPKGAAGYELLVDQKGRHTLSLELRIGATRDGDRRTVSFSLPPVPLSRLSLDLPGSATEVKVEPRLASTTEHTPAGGTRLLAFLGPVAKIQIQWRQKSDEGPKVEPLVFAAEQHDVRIDRGVTRSEMTADLSILRAPLESLALQVPADAVTLYVQGNGIRTWTRSDDGKRIRIELREPVREHWQLKVGLEAPLPTLPATVPLPLAQVDGVERETGFLRLLAGEGVKVEPQETSGLLQVDLAELPEPLRNAPAGRTLGYRFPARPGAVTVAVDSLAPRIKANVATRVVVRPEGTELRYAAQVDVERSGVFGLSLEIPEALADLEITAVRVQGAEQDDYKVKPAAKGRVLSVQFRDRLLGNATLQVDGRLPTPLPPEDDAESESEFHVPLLHLVGAEHVKGIVLVQVDPALEHHEKAREGLVSIDASAPVPFEPPAVPGPAAPLAYRLEHHESPASLVLALKRRDPSVVARVESFVKLEPDRTRLGATLRYRVRYRGVDTLRFSAPLTVGRLMHLDMEGVQLVGPEPLETPAGAPERGIWTIRLPSPRLGEIPIVLDIEDVPETALSSGASRDVLLPSFVPMTEEHKPLPNTVHEVAVRRDPLLEVTTRELVKIEEIDTRELPKGLEDDQNFMAFRSYDPAWQASLRLTRHDYEPVAEIVVSHVHLDTVIGREGRATTEAYLVVRNNDRQTLEVALPPGAAIRSLSVDGKSKQPRQGAGGKILVPLPSGLGKDAAFVIKLVYDHDVERSSTLFFENVSLESLRLGSDVTTDLLTWRVYAPEERAYTSFGGTALPADPRHSWFRSLVDQVFRTFGKKAQAADAPVARLAGRFDSPSEPRHSGRELLFSNRLGQGTVTIGSADPQAFAFWKLLWFVVLLGVMLVLAGLARRTGLGEGRILLAAALVILVLLVRAGPGTAEVLNAMLLGVLLAAVVRLVMAAARARRERWDAERTSPPEATPHDALPPEAAPEGGAA